MRSRRQRSSIDVIARVVDRVHRAWVEGRMAGLLIIDVKGAFGHLSQSCQLRTMEGIEADGNLIR